MNRWLARQLYFGFQSLRTEPVRRAYYDVLKTEFLSSDALFELQAQRQIAQLKYAFRNVPYYKNKFADYGEIIEYLHDRSDLDQLMYELPVLYKDTVRSDYLSFRSKELPRLRTFPDKTSGSSGTPLSFPCDQVSWAYRHALYFRCMKSYNIEVGEPYIYFYGAHWSKRSKLNLWLRDNFFNRVRVSAYQMSPEKIDLKLNQIFSHKPTHFLGYPSAIYEFCVLLYERGIDFHKLNLKAIILSSEPVLPFQRTIIQSVTNSRVVNTYGSAEGGSNAFECPEGNLHIAIESTWLQSNESTSHSGEALVTDMFLRAFPLIKYSIGDEIFFKYGNCACGRFHPMLDEIKGRSGDQITLPNGKKISSHLPGYIFKTISELGVIRQFRFVQKKDGLLILYLVVTSKFEKRYLDVIVNETRNAFGADVIFSIEIVDNLPTLANAKYKSYIYEE